MVWGVGALIGINAGISAISAKKKAEERNKLIEARKAWAHEEKKYANQMFEIQTYQRSFAKEAAGARRLGRAASSGLGTVGAQILNQFDSIFEGFDTKVREMAHAHELRRIDAEINQLSSQVRSPGKAAGFAFLTAGVEGLTYAAAAGAFNKKSKTKAKTAKADDGTYTIPKDVTSARDNLLGIGSYGGATGSW